MRTNLLSRRSFLQQGLFGALAVGFIPTGVFTKRYSDSPIGRVTASRVRVRQYPSSDAVVNFQINRDEIVNLYENILVEGNRNPLWYRVWGGFIHSAYIQPVEFSAVDTIEDIPECGCLFEVSVPYTRSYRLKTKNWIPNYRLYFNSTHWVVGSAPGPDGDAFYEIMDSYSRSYFARASHLRRVGLNELAPISPEVPRHQKWVEVFIGDQKLKAYENDAVVLETDISSGLPLNRPVEEDELPTETPHGDHFITVKTVSRHMGETNFTGELETGAYPGVPWVSFFDKGGYSLHGTYWHNNFGSRMSHGCVNMRCEEAKWIYRWSLPAAQPDSWQTDGWGIRVSIRE